MHQKLDFYCNLLQVFSSFKCGHATTNKKKGKTSLLLGIFALLLDLQKHIAWEQSGLTAVSQPCNEIERDGTEADTDLTDFQPIT